MDNRPYLRTILGGTGFRSLSLFEKILCINVWLLCLCKRYAKKGMKMKKAVNTLNLYLPFLTFHDGTCRAGWNFADTLLYFIRL